MTTSAVDPYREWDAAYVMGSLSSSERHEYEQHLDECPVCSNDVTDLAGLSGILAVVPAADAFSLLDEDAMRPEEEVPPALLTNVLRLAERDRVLSRRRIGPVVIRTLAVAASIAVAISLVVWGVSSQRDNGPGGGELVTMAQTVPSPITADARLVAEPWGTTITLTCRYAEPAATDPIPTGPTSFEYALYVTDTAGVEKEIGSWSASPGSVVEPAATTNLTVDQISHIDVRFVPMDVVILTVAP